MKKKSSHVSAIEDPEHLPQPRDNYDDATQFDDWDGEQWAELSRRSVDEDDQYPEDWPVLSRRLREEMDWQCELCGRSFRDRPDRLHVHHRSGVKSDNSRSNLQVLCADCHAQQPE